MSRREREFTPEEAMAITLLDVTPNWYGSAPLAIGVNLPERAYPQPLDPILNQGVWVFFFVGATGAEFPRVRETFQNWVRRFRPLGVKFVFAINGDYPYFRERRVMEAWIGSLGFSAPVVWDVDRALARSFGASRDPALGILRDGSIATVEFEGHWTEVGETKLQALLRENSPGLPFWPVVHEPEKVARTLARWPLHAGAKAVLENKVQFIGNWIFDEDRLVTNDSKAELVFTSPASEVAIVARSLSETGDPTRIRFEIEDGAFLEPHHGKDFLTDHEGFSAVQLAGPRAYYILKDLEPTHRKLRFRFPSAKVSAVALYGFEFGEKFSPTSA